MTTPDPVLAAHPTPWTWRTETLAGIGLSTPVVRDANGVTVDCESPAFAAFIVAAVNRTQPSPDDRERQSERERVARAMYDEGNTHMRNAGRRGFRYRGTS